MGQFLSRRHWIRVRQRQRRVMPELELRIDTDLGSVFEDMSLDRFSIDGILGHTVLINAHGS